MAPMMRIAFEKIEKVQEKGAKPSYGHLLLFPDCFQKYSFSASLRFMIVR